jgi:hypothetical protein
LKGKKDRRQRGTRESILYSEDGLHPPFPRNRRDRKRLRKRTKQYKLKEEHEIVRDHIYMIWETRDKEFWDTRLDP